MKAKPFFKTGVCLMAVVMLIARPELCFARGERDQGRYERREHYGRQQERVHGAVRGNVIGRNYVPVVVGGMRYYYLDGGYYLPRGREYVFVTPPVGAVVPVIPQGYRLVNINGVTYYTSAGTYYIYTPYGYQVVRPPVAQYVVARPVVVQPVEVRPQPVYYNPPNQTKVAEGIGLGGMLGALLGGVVGYQMKGRNQVNGALLGAAVGATTGGILGAQIPN
jgi:hypothetical protein